MFELVSDLLSAYWGFAWGLGFGILLGGFSVAVMAHHHYKTGPSTSKS